VILPESKLLATAKHLLHHEGLEAADADRLVRMLDQGDGLRLRRGQVLFEQGDPGDSLAVLVEGSVQVTAKDQHGADNELALLHAPVMLGHIAMVDEAPRSATVKAAQECLVVLLRKEVFDRLVRTRGQDADLLRALMLGAMFRQLAQATDELRRLMAMSPDNVIELLD
jgi:CRP/FNR family cyclic AMP-dependent transcriptional regulator